MATKAHLSMVDMQLPTGTVTFLFSDIEGSTGLLQRLGERYDAVLAEHQGLIRGEIAAGGGVEVSTSGDSFFAVFPSAAGAVRAAVAMQRAILGHDWPPGVALRVRIGVHTGEGRVRNGDYVGLDVHRAARIGDAAHGGQILVSAATRELIADLLPPAVSLRDLGEYELRGVAKRVTLHQVVGADLPVDFPPPRTLGGPSHNLPTQLTRFIGRERELAEMATRLATSRLLTLTGVGGSGKTRLALEAASRALADHPAGVWLVELADIADPALVPSALADALGIEEQPRRSLVDTLIDVLQHKRLLVVLDNCEHLLEGAGRLVATLLQALDGLRVIATSREILGAPGEVVVGVPPMELPESSAGLEASEPHRFDAIQLFVQRAQSVSPDFQLDEQNVESVFDICRRLDGMPLAIELAAARLRVLSPGEIAERLDDRFHLLTGGARTSLPRQQTLEAAVAWSFDLLSPVEQTFFPRLSVFSAGFTLEAAEAVSTGEEIAEGQVLDLLQRLVDQSMVVADPTSAHGSRFRLLETLRDYGRNRLAASGRAEDVRARHAAYFVALAQQAAPRLRTEGQEAWLDRLDLEHENLRGALSWLAGTGRADEALRLAGSLAGFWQRYGYWSEGRRWLALALDLPASDLAAKVEALLGAVPLFIPEDPKQGAEMARAALQAARESGDRRLVARALQWSGYAVLDRSELATPLLREALAIFEELDDSLGAADTLTSLASANAVSAPDLALEWAERSASMFRAAGDRAGVAEAQQVAAAVARGQGRYDQAWERLEESLEAARQLGGRERGGHALRDLGEVALARGDPAGAAPYLEESLELLRHVGDRHCSARVLRSLGTVAVRSGRTDEAARLLREALEISSDVRDRRNVVWTLEALAELARNHGDPPRAAFLLGAAASIRDARNMKPTLVEQQARDEAEAALRSSLGDATYLQQLSAGHGLDLPAAIAAGLETEDLPLEPDRRTRP